MGVFHLRFWRNKRHLREIFLRIQAWSSLAYPDGCIALFEMEADCFLRTQVYFSLS